MPMVINELKEYIFHIVWGKFLEILKDKFDLSLIKLNY